MLLFVICTIISIVPRHVFFYMYYFLITRLFGTDITRDRLTHTNYKLPCTLCLQAALEKYNTLQPTKIQRAHAILMMRNLHWFNLISLVFVYHITTKDIEAFRSLAS